MLRHIHDVFYLIDIHANYYNDEFYLYEVNEMGAFIWENIESAGTISKLARMLQDQIKEKVDISILQKDIDEFVHILCVEGYLITGI